MYQNWHLQSIFLGNIVLAKIELVSHALPNFYYEDFKIFWKLKKDLHMTIT
jgi:hypothetical protein